MQGLDNVLLIIDVCQAGQVAGEVTIALEEAISGAMDRLAEHERPG